MMTELTQITDESYILYIVSFTLPPYRTEKLLFFESKNFKASLRFDQTEFKTYALPNKIRLGRQHRLKVRP